MYVNESWNVQTHNLIFYHPKIKFLTVKSFLKRFIDQFEVTGDLQGHFHWPDVQCTLYTAFEIFEHII